MAEMLLALARLVRFDVGVGVGVDDDVYISDHIYIIINHICMYSGKNDLVI